MNAYKTIIENYVIWLETLGFSNGMITDYKCRLSDFFVWLENRQIQSISQLTNIHITAYQNYLETRPNKTRKGQLLGVSHLNHNFLAIDKLLEFLHQYDMANVPVPTNYRMKIDQQERIDKIEVLTKQDVKTLFDYIPNMYGCFDFEKQQAKQHELKLIFTLYYGCGLRLAEDYNVKMQDVDFDKKTVFVQQGKNYKDRIIPMSSGVYNQLKDYIYNFRHCLKVNHSRLFVCKKTALHHKIKYLQQMCDDETIKAKRLSLHVLRHSIATHLLQNGMSIENISLFLGHNSLNTTQIYTRLT